MRFRRVSFPISAMLSIVAILLYFHPGLNLGIDFRGGTLIEVQQRSGPADLAKMRSTLNQLNLGDVQLQQFGGPENVLIRISEQPGGETAQQEAVAKVKGALGDSVEYRRVEVVGPRVSGELLSYGTIGIMLAIGGILLYLRFRLKWQFEAEPQIKQDPADRQHDADGAVGEQLARHARADDLDPAVFHAVSQRAFHLGDRLLLRGLAPGLLGNADQDVFGAAELLQLDVAEVELVEG